MLGTAEGRHSGQSRLDSGPGLRFAGRDSGNQLLGTVLWSEHFPGHGPGHVAAGHGHRLSIRK